mmetsp:Transcript_61629/g.127343  ORF Transcript_61629/g.127343 Transcript_61629/m.127343 type:complete len:145 (+) Transcript_61629:2427-2861(+)
MEQITIFLFEKKFSFLKKMWGVFGQKIKKKKQNLFYLRKNKNTLSSFGQKISSFLFNSQLINPKNEIKFHEVFGFSSSNFGFIKPKPEFQVRKKNSNKSKTRLGFHEKIFGFLKVYHKKNKPKILDQIVSSKIIKRATYKIDTN